MSNVLIGIIGVVLFIGLALAGAVLLGDEFKSASRDSKVTALVAAMQQIPQGIGMFELKTGGQFPAYTPINESPLLIPRFVKTPYVDPENGGWPVVLLYGGQRYLALGALSDAMCRGVQSQTKGVTTYPTTDGSAALDGINGCVNDRGNLLIYVKI